MSKLGVVCGAAVLALGAFASCGSDDKARRVEAEDAGAAGMEAGDGGGPEQGGSSSQPSAGQGGMPVVAEGGAGGEPVAPVGGHGGVGQGGAGGVAEGGAGGIDCPLQPGAFTQSCGEVTEFLQPTYVTADGTFRLDVSSLPFPIATANAVFFYHEDAAQYCNTETVDVTSSEVVIPLEPHITPTLVRIVDFTLTDVCGSTYRYDPIGAPECNDLQGSGPAGTWDLDCVIRFGACPDQCE